ncbi:MAG: ATP-binding protein [Pirellula sp.]|jgi:two-component system sensor histidine kinase RstB|nr:ATP-binding protein [Pirellula sp.]
MTQLFIRFYLGVLAVLFVSWWIYGYVLQLRYEADRARVVTEAHASGLRLVASELSKLPDAERRVAMEQYSTDFRSPIEIRSLRELDPKVRTVLSGPGTSSYIQWSPYEEGVAVVVDDETYLRMGPFPNYELFAIEDSMRGWMRAASRYVHQAGPPYADGIASLQPRFDLKLDIDYVNKLSREVAQRLKGSRDVIFYAKDDQQFYVSSLLDRYDDSAPVLTVGPLPKFNREERPAATTTLALVLLPAAVAILLLLRPVANQLQQVESAAQAFAGGNLRARVDESHIGSARNLARAFNQMASRTETMVRTQRELLQAVSHELKTPLARIRFSMDLASTATDDVQRNRRLEAIDQAVEDLDGLVEELVSYVRMENASVVDRRELVSVTEVLDSLIDRHRCLYPDMDFCWTSSPSHEIPSGDSISVMADRAAFHRALGNLIGNAARFAKSRVEVKVIPSLRTVCIDIEDDGPGIPETERQRVLEPFVRLEDQPEERASKTGAGVGLGLAIVKRTIEQHAGSLEIGVSEQGGCRVRTCWPTAAP